MKDNGEKRLCGKVSGPQREPTTCRLEAHHLSCLEPQKALEITWYIHSFIHNTSHWMLPEFPVLSPQSTEAHWTTGLHLHGADCLTGESKMAHRYWMPSPALGARSLEGMAADHGTSVNTVLQAPLPAIRVGTNKVHLVHASFYRCRNWKQEKGSDLPIILELGHSKEFVQGCVR